MDVSDGCISSKSEIDQAKPEVMDENDDDLFASQDGEPATQPCDDLSLSQSDDLMEGSQEEIDPVWGFLYPIREGWKVARLIDDINTFGRSVSNKFPIDEDQAGDHVMSISKVHFLIKKSPSGTVLVDKSSNGTYVNNKLVGKGKSRLLEHNSSIALSDPKVKSYIYMSSSRDFQRDYPRELTSKYVVSKVLGSGACGVVHLGFKIADTPFPQRLAIKIIDKKKIPITKGASSDVLNEVRILRAVDHPNIIRLEDVIDTKNFLFIILELADGGELFDKIVAKTRINEAEARVHFYQLVSAVQYMHTKNVAHRDLKPENILLCSPDDSKPLIKITDLGLSKLVDMESKLKTFCGTPQYLAPEVLISRVRGDGSYGFEVDLWSLGVILYVLLSGCPPFSPDRTDKPLVRQVCDGDFKFPEGKWYGVSAEAIDLVKKLMTVDRKKRLTAKQVLEHPWLNRRDVKDKVKELIDLAKKLRGESNESNGDMGPPMPIVREPERDLESPPSKKPCLGPRRS